jgi:Flp pilus assembly protein TadG
MVHHPYNEIKDEGMTVARLATARMKDEKRMEGLHPSSRGAIPHAKRSERGAVSIEMVFFLLIFVVAFFGAIEMAREVSVKHALDVGTYRAARYLSIVPSDQTTARNMIQTELNSNVLGGAGSVVMNVDMPSQSFQTVFSVTADVPYQPVIPLMIFAPKTLRVIHSQSIEAYP